MLDVALGLVEGVLEFLLRQLGFAERCLRSLHFLTQLGNLAGGLVALIENALGAVLVTLELLLDAILLLLCVLELRLQAIYLALTLLEFFLESC